MIAAGYGLQRRGGFGLVLTQAIKLLGALQSGSNASPIYRQIRLAADGFKAFRAGRKNAPIYRLF
jgi:hypothetical protein